MVKTTPRVGITGFLVMSLLLSVVLIGGSILAPTAAPAASRVILCTNYPVGHPLVDGLQKFQKIVAERSNGKYEVRLIDNGKFGSVSAQMQALQAGTINFMAAGTGSCEPFFPQLSIFDLPYMITNFESGLAEKLLSPVVTEYLHSLSTKRVEILSVLGCGVRYIFSKKPIRTLEDAQGLKMRTTPSRLHMNIMSALGMTPTPLAFSELYTALQQGVVEGCDPELPSGVSMSFRDVAPYWAKFDTSANVGLLFANAPWWNRLPAEDRQMFTDAIHEAAEWIINTQQTADSEIIAKEKAEGREVYIPSPEEKQRWIDATAEVYKQHPEISGAMLKTLRKSFVAPVEAKQ